jgi:hypothetical protein
MLEWERNCKGAWKNTPIVHESAELRRIWTGATENRDQGKRLVQAK